jgi:hypothetical protein
MHPRESRLYQNKSPSNTSTEGNSVHRVRDTPCHDHDNDNQRATLISQLSPPDLYGRGKSERTAGTERSLLPTADTEWIWESWNDLPRSARLSNRLPQGALPLNSLLHSDIPHQWGLETEVLHCLETRDGPGLLRTSGIWMETHLSCSSTSGTWGLSGWDVNSRAIWLTQSRETELNSKDFALLGPVVRRELSSACRLLLLLISCSAYSWTPKMKAIRSTETSACLSELHSFTTQKTTLFTGTSVRTPNPKFSFYLSVCLSIYLSIYLWLYSPLSGLGRFVSFLIFYTVGRTHWTGHEPVARPLPAHRTTQTQNKHTQASVPRLGFEPTIPVFERAKTVCLRPRGHCDRLQTLVRCTKRVLHCKQCRLLTVAQ